MSAPWVASDHITTSSQRERSHVNTIDIKFKEMPRTQFPKLEHKIASEYFDVGSVLMYSVGHKNASIYF